jgi:hypothetical protein
MYARPLFPGVYGVGPGFSIEMIDAVCVTLPEHAGRSLLRHLKSRNQTIYGGSALKVVHQLD